MNAVISANETGLPERIGPHGIDLNKRRGVTRYRIEGANARIVARLKREVAAKANTGLSSASARAAK